MRVWYTSAMTLEIDSTEHYIILDVQHLCCDQSQFVYVCKHCEERMGCYFCEFDYTERHDCDMMGI